MGNQAVLVFSGGMDSTTLLYSFLAKNFQIKALGVDYGQRHVKELNAARAICEKVEVEFQVADLSRLRPLLAGSSLTNTVLEVPEGHYTDERMRITMVPNRNMLMLSAAIAWAISSNFNNVAYAAHAGDYSIYPDCRPGFINALARAAKLCHYHPIRVLRPFIRKTKTEIARIGYDLGVPFSLTWSCYKGQKLHCGRCGTCTERAEAFVLAGLPDPTNYASTPSISAAK